MRQLISKSVKLFLFIIVFQSTAANAQKSFSFKCHRDDQQKMVYAVNAISFNQQTKTFATVGADGGYVFWDKDSKSRLKKLRNFVRGRFRSYTPRQVPRKK